MLWFSLASLLVVWDAFFILLRPRTLPGGDLHAFWKPCKHLCLQPIKLSVTTGMLFGLWMTAFKLCVLSIADELYIWVDKRYGDMADTFGIAQSW